MTINKAVLPENLISLAKKTPSVSVGIVCPHKKSELESIKMAFELNLIDPIFIGNTKIINETSSQINWKIDNFRIFDHDNENESAKKGAELAKENKIKVLIKGNLHTDILMKIYLKKEYGLIEGKRLSHIWHMTIPNSIKPLFISDGALNVLPRADVKMHILNNVVEFAKKTGIKKPRVAILSGTEDPIESMPSSIEAKEIMERSIKNNIEAFVYGPLALDNAISSEAAEIKNIKNEVAGKADILLVPNLETGNALSKMMVYFLDACAAGIVVGGKVPIVVPSRADNSISKLASLAAAIIASQ